MTLWLIAVPIVVALGWLTWWGSGRARPDLRRRAASTEIAIREASPGSFDVRGDGGPAPGGGF